MTSYNDILQNQILPLGPWQIRTYLLYIFSSPFLLIYYPVFPGLRPHHICRPVGFGRNNWTLTQWANLTAPVLSSPPARGQSFDGCRAYALPSDVNLNMSFQDARLAMNEAQRSANLTTEPCQNGWLFMKETAAFRDTLVAHFDLVCGRSHLLIWSTTLFMIGFIVGALLFGEVGDRLGRKPTAILTLFLAMGATVLTSFAPTVEIFMLGRFLVGALTQGHYVVTYTLVMEISGSKARDIFTTCCSMFISVMYLCWYSLMAYLIPSWRWLHMVCSACMLAVFLYFPFMPESPRWLITKGRYEEALKEIRRAIRLNNPDKVIQLELSDLQPLASSAEDEAAKVESPPGLLDLFRTPLLRKITLLMMIAWFSHALSYYSASFYSVKLKGLSPYLAFTIPTALKLVFLGIQLIMARYLPRRPCLVAFQILGGLCCAVVAVLHLLPGISQTGKNIVGMTFMSLFLGFVVAGFALIYVYASELFPTSLRSRGIGACSMVSRVGATLSPFVVDLDRSMGIRSLPMAVCGVVCGFAGLSSLFLPETKGKPMAECAVQLESMFGKGQADVAKNEEKKEDESRML